MIESIVVLVTSGTNKDAVTAISIAATAPMYLSILPFIYPNIILKRFIIQLLVH